MIVAFRVCGTPKPKGSKSRGRFGGVYESNKGTMSWVRQVADEAKIVMSTGKANARTPFTGPVKVRLRFYFKRPKNHFRANGELKWWAPLWKQSAPDIDKCTRAVLDGMQPWIVKDDAQVTTLEVLKTYCPLGMEPGVVIDVRELA